MKKFIPPVAALLVIALFLAGCLLFPKAPPQSVSEPKKVIPPQTKSLTLQQLEQYYLQHPFKLSESPKAGVFDIVVFIDTLSYNVPPQELYKTLTYTERLFFSLTGVPLAFLDIVEVNSKKKVFYPERGYALEKELSPNEIFQDYFSSRPEKKFEGLIYFYKDSIALSHGGRMATFSPEGNFCNEFSAPDKKTEIIYGGLIDWSHIYGWCGYDHQHYEKTGELLHISNVSFGGQCKNQDNVPCIFKEGYYQCQNLLEAPESDLAYLRASSIIHEWMHHFTGIEYGQEGNYDHEGTSWCNKQLENPEYEEYLGQEIDYLGICPVAFYHFKNSENFCD